MRDTNHPQWNCPAGLRGRPSHDMTSSKRHRRPHRASNHRDPAAHKAEDQRRAKHLFSPARPNSVGDGIDLVIGQHSARLLRECRHGGSRNSVRGYATDRGIVGDGEVHRVAESNRSAALAIGAMATGAVLSIETIEVHDLAWRDHLRIRRRASRGTGLGCRKPLWRPSTPVARPRWTDASSPFFFVTLFVGQSGRFETQPEGER